MCAHRHKPRVLWKRRMLQIEKETRSGTKRRLRRLSQGQYKNAKNLDGGNIKAPSEAAAVSNPISYSLTSLPQTALTEYTTLHKRRLSRCPKICQSLWLQHLGSYSLASKVSSGCGWLPPEAIRVFHTPSKYLIGCLLRDHSQPSDPWPCLGS